MIDINSDSKIALIGCGKMGGAILDGWIASEAEPASFLSGKNFTVICPDEETLSRVEEGHGAATLRSVSEVDDISRYDMIVLAVKPQVMPSVLEELAAVLSDTDSDPLIVTIAAGITTSAYESALSGALGKGARVVRVMPNMPLQIGAGATVVAGGSNAEDDDVELVNRLFSALGFSSKVREDEIDAVCAISGGGPAYVAYMIEALRDAGVELGLDADLACRLALDTVGGTYLLMSKGDISPEDMRISVCSPGGTTLAALAAMDDAGFKPMFSDGMKAAVRRAAELRGE